MGNEDGELRRGDRSESERLEKESRPALIAAGLLILIFAFALLLAH